MDRSLRAEVLMAEAVQLGVTIDDLLVAARTLGARHGADDRRRVPRSDRANLLARHRSDVRNVLAPGRCPLR